jgi:hypothetical protein
LQVVAPVNFFRGRIRVEVGEDPRARTLCQRRKECGTLKCRSTAEAEAYQFNVNSRSGIIRLRHSSSATACDQDRGVARKDRPPARLPEVRSVPLSCSGFKGRFTLEIVLCLGIMVHVLDAAPCCTTKRMGKRVDRTAVLGLQRWVNDGHEPWRMDASPVAAEEIVNLDPRLRGVPLEPLQPPSPEGN